MISEQDQSIKMTSLDRTRQNAPTVWTVHLIGGHLTQLNSNLVSMYVPLNMRIRDNVTVPNFNSPASSSFCKGALAVE